jgi:hypothetical protein
MALTMPVADDAAIFEYSYTTGEAGVYQLAGAWGGFFTFKFEWPAGAASIPIRVTDGSSNTEISNAAYDAGANTLTVIGSPLASTNGGAFVNWTGRTRLLVHALVGATPEDDVFIHRVTSGTIDSFLILPASQNIIIWSSAAGGAKTQTIPSAGAYDSIILHVKMNPTVRGTLTISPAAGTIEEQSSIDIFSPDSVMLLGDGIAGNWVSL